MKVFVTGTRGIPDIPGGVEQHCQQLYPLITTRGWEVTLATRQPYAKDKEQRVWQGVRLMPLYAPRQKHLEAIVHTFVAVIRARLCQADIIHIHAVGPGLMVPLARILGMTVVLTHHGPDYQRQKWGPVARAVLRLGEWVSGRTAHEVIAVSRLVRDIVYRRCGRKATVIYNGVPRAAISRQSDFLDGLGIMPGNYILAVSRFVPEKGLHLLLEAFKGSNTDIRLVIAGDADHETDYSLRLKQDMADDPRIVHVGYITGEPLNQLFTHARLFVLPSFYEGLPITLLEAMSYGLPVLVSDIPAIREIALSEGRFFKCGDVADLKQKIAICLEQGISGEDRQELIDRVKATYNWTVIAGQTAAVYEKALRRYRRVRSGN